MLIKPVKSQDLVDFQAHFEFLALAVQGHEFCRLKNNHKIIDHMQTDQQMVHCFPTINMNKQKKKTC